MSRPKHGQTKQPAPVFPDARIGHRSELGNAIVPLLPITGGQDPIEHLPGGTIVSTSGSAQLPSAEQWAFQPYFVADLLFIRTGVVGPGNVVPELAGSALDAVPPPSQVGKKEGTHVVWFLIEHDLKTEGYYDAATETTRYRAANGGEVLNVEVKLTTGQAPSGAREGVFSEASGSVSQTPILLWQVNRIVNGSIQGRLEANTSGNLQLMFCPPNQYTIIQAWSSAS